MASISNVRPVSAELEQAILLAFGRVAADALEAPDPSPPVGDKLTLEDLRFTLRGLVESAGTLYRAVVRLEREKLSLITMDCDCVDAGAAAAVFAMAVREAVERAVAAKHEVKPFRRVGNYSVARVAPCMTDEQYRDSQLFARRMAVERQDGLTCARDLQSSVPQEVITMIVDTDPDTIAGQLERLYEVSNPDDGEPDDERGWIPSPEELAQRIAAVRAGKVASHA